MPDPHELLIALVALAIAVWLLASRAACSAVGLL